TGDGDLGWKRIRRRAGAACRCATACRRAGRGALRRPSLVVVLAADQCERAALASSRLDMVQEGVLAPMRYPHLPSASLRDGCGQLVPIGVVGDHKRKLDALLARARADPHPT